VSKHFVLDAPLLERSLLFPYFCISDCGIEIVDQWSHLGHVFSSKGDDLYDILRCRNSFIGQVNNLLCHFDKLHSLIRNRLFLS